MRVAVKRKKVFVAPAGTRAWLHSFMDALVDDVENRGAISDERFEQWTKAIMAAMRLITPVKRRELPDGCIRLDDPRWLEAA